MRVRVQQIPWTAAHEKLLTSFVGEATPDVAQLGNTWIPEFVALAALERLDSQVARSSVVSPDAYFEGIWQTNVVEGGVYGIPWYVDTRVLFYRTDLLDSVGYEEPPKTWEEWLDAMEGLRAHMGEGRWPILLPTNEWPQPVILGLQNGSRLLDDQGARGAFSEPPFRDAFRFYVDLFRRGYAPPVANTQIANLFQQFARGDFAMVITGPWGIGEFRRRLPAGVPWTTAPLPGPDGPGLSMAGGSSLVLFAGSDAGSAAWRFVEYLSRPENQVRFYELTGDLPARVEAAPGVTVEHVDAGPAQPIPKDDLLPYMDEFAGLLRRSFRADPPDVVHAHFWMSGLAALGAGRPLGLPVVQTFHALGVVKRRHQGAKDTSPPGRVREERRLAEAADRIVATCSDEVFELVRMGADLRRVAVVPCGVDLGMFRPEGPAASRPSGAARLLVVSRLVERKGQEFELEAARILTDERSDLHVAFLGPCRERERPYKERLVARAGLFAGSDRIHFLDAREDVPAVLADADVLVRAALTEGLPNVALEAMAMRVPVTMICPRCGRTGMFKPTIGASRALPMPAASQATCWSHIPR